MQARATVRTVLIRTLSTLLSKTIIFVFLFVLFVSATPAHAAGFEKYRDLFGARSTPGPVEKGTAGAINRTESGIFYIGSTLFNNGVKEFYLGGNLFFPETTSNTLNADIEKNIWDFVADEGKGTTINPRDTIVLRTYEIKNGSIENIEYVKSIYTLDYNPTVSTVTTGGGSFGGSVGNQTVFQGNAASFKNSFFKKENYVDRTNGQRRDKYLIDQKINIKVNPTTAIPYGAQMGADLWYCGGKAEGYSDGNFDADSMPNNFDEFKDHVAFFDGLCNDTAYWQIGPSIRFTMPASSQDTAGGAVTDDQVATAATTAGYSQAAGSPASSLPNCHILNGAGPGEGSFVGCFAWITYYVIYTPIKWFAGLLGMLFDFFLGYSLSDTSYRAEFAVRGWQIVRDISNIFFIIILVWTGLSTVFGGSINIKKVVSNLILNALIINFSLFGTRVIIDISNIVARVFYKSIYVCEGPCDKNADGTFKNLKTGPGGVTPLSEKIIGSFNPQKIFSTAILSSDNATKSNVTGGVTGNVVVNDDNQTGQEKNPLNNNDYATYFIIVSLIAAAILIAVAMMFWKTAFFFLGRVIGLYVAMIFAPFAVLTRGNMPLLNNVKDLSWDNWLKDLTNYAMLAPIFVFFLYVIYSFLDTDFLKISFGDLNNASFMTVVISITVPMLIVYFMINQGVKIAEKYAGKIGEMVQKGAMKVAGLAGGVALGGAGLLGGRVIGGLAKAADESRIGSGIRDLAARGGFVGGIGKNLQKGLNATRSGSFDLRQTSLGQNLFKQMGVDTNQKGLNALAGFGLGLGTDQRKGGLDADIKRRQEKQVENAKLFEEKMNDDQIKAYNKRQKEKYDRKVNDVVDQDIADRMGMTLIDVAKMIQTNKVAYDAERARSLADASVKAKVDAVQAPKEMKKAADLTADRNKKYEENLKKGGLVTQGLSWMSKQGPLGEATSDVLGAIYAPIGAATGSGVRNEGDRKAAKKLKEKNKVIEDLDKIYKTLDKGFENLIAMKTFQTSPSFTGLHPDEQTELIRDGVITTNIGGNKGKEWKDILTDAEKDQLTADVKAKRNPKDKKGEDELATLYEQLKVVQGAKFNMNTLNKTLKRTKTNLENNPTDPTALSDYITAIEELEKAKKHQKTWQDVNKHIEEQKKKLKGDDEKK